MQRRGRRRFLVQRIECHWTAIVVAGNTLAIVDGLKDSYVADAA
jgi:hypothetical protein